MRPTTMAPSCTASGLHRQFQHLAFAAHAPGFAHRLPGLDAGADQLAQLLAVDDRCLAHGQHHVALAQAGSFGGAARHHLANDRRGSRDP